MNILFKKKSAIYILIMVDVFFCREVPSEGKLLLKIKTDACAGTDSQVNYLEHVQVVITVNATRRGALNLFLTSPMGTRYDLNYDYFRHFLFHRETCSKTVFSFLLFHVAFHWEIFVFCRSMILNRRANDDDSRDGFTKWPFMTTHAWGEYPEGIWSLEAS